MRKMLEELYFFCNINPNEQALDKRSDLSEALLIDFESEDKLAELPEVKEKKLIFSTRYCFFLEKDLKYIIY